MSLRYEMATFAVLHKAQSLETKDGVVDEREFMEAGGTKQEFDRYDLNGDGVLNEADADAHADGNTDADADYHPSRAQTAV